MNIKRGLQGPQGPAGPPGTPGVGAENFTISSGVLIGPQVISSGEAITMNVTFSDGNFDGTSYIPVPGGIYILSASLDISPIGLTEPTYVRLEMGPPLPEQGVAAGQDTYFDPAVADTIRITLTEYFIYTVGVPVNVRVIIADGVQMSISNLFFTAGGVLGIPFPVSM